MQQTQKYKLNLIESSDPFLPEGLNQNTRKIENALTAHEAAVEEVTDGLDQRVTVLEKFKVAVGGCLAGNVVELGFTPVAVFLHNGEYDSSVKSILVVTGRNTRVLEIIDGGFDLKTYSSGLNNFSGWFSFIAFGYAD